MQLTRDLPKRTWVLILACAVFALCVFLLMRSVAAEEQVTGSPATTDRSSDVVRVEEDWELIVSQPAPASDAPQVTCIISPFGNVAAAYVAFEINHQSKPVYSAGGMQLQVWSGGAVSVTSNAQDGVLLSQPDETVTWTQQMAMADGAVTVTIVNGGSQTWGMFGGLPSVRFNTSLTDLNAYSPVVSTQQSKIGFGANRVQSLTLKRVRTFTAANKVIRDEGPRVVYQHP